MLIRIFDILVALLIIILLSPILFITAICIKIDSKGPVLFWQRRVGYRVEEFWIVKFRTMLDKPNEDQITSSKNIKSVTRVGKYIRKFHLDEVVQLFNVIKGDMSIVGPRPEVPRYVKYHKKLWAKVLSIKPGITGYATVNLVDKEYEILKNSIDPENDYINVILPKKLEEEIFYVNNYSLKLNMIIIFKTLVKIFF